MTRPAASFLLVTLALAPALRAGSPDLAAALPGSTHLAALVDVHSFVADFPNLSRQGLIGARLDDLAARGFPDPRKGLQSLALAGNLGAAGLDEGLALAASDAPVVPLIQRLAGEQCATLDRCAYRGVAFVTGTWKGRSSRFADLADGRILCAFDRQNQYKLASAAIDVLGGQAPGYLAAGGKSLAPGTYLSARMVLDDKTRDALSSGKLAHLANLVGGSAVLARTGNGVRLEIQAKATGSMKAMVASTALSFKLGSLAKSVADPALAAVLKSAKVERDGATLIITAEASAADLEGALLAAQGIVKQKLDARRAAKAGAAD